MRKLVAVAVILSLSSTGVMAKPSLRNVGVVEDGLFAISVADKIRKECDTISGRVLKAMGQMRKLADHARDLGYMDDEIKTYVDSRTEKSRMRAKRDAYLTKQGVVNSQPETYCAAGRAEIQKSSRIGALLKAR